MKKLALIILSLLLFQPSRAQDTVSVEKSLIGGHIGYLGTWVNYEAKLSNRITFKTEVGLEKRYLISTLVPTNKSFHPIIGVESRYYYNLDRRFQLSKKTRGNTANFWALQVKYNLPFVIDDKASSNNREAIIFTPKYGIRRTLGNHFNLETTLGVGYDYEFNKNAMGGFFIIEGTLRLGFHF